MHSKTLDVFKLITTLPETDILAIALRLYLLLIVVLCTCIRRMCLVVSECFTCAVRCVLVQCFQMYVFTFSRAMRCVFEIGSVLRVVQLVCSLSAHIGWIESVSLWLGALSQMGLIHQIFEENWEELPSVWVHRIQLMDVQRPTKQTFMSSSCERDPVITAHLHHRQIILKKKKSYWYYNNADCTD